MRSMQFISVVALLMLATACRQDVADANAVGEGDAPEPASGQASQAEEARRQADATRPGEATGPRGELIDGPLASDPGFRMPVPGSNMGQADSAPAVPLDGDTVRLALIDGMEESGAGIRVQVGPRGTVSLSGEVATIADRQRAHYLARALPGVAEVDFRDLRVRQR